MPETSVDLFRSVRQEQFPDGTIIDNKPATGVLYPDFEPRELPNGSVRPPDVELSADKQWVKAGGGTSLFDRPNVFKGKGWLSFPIPEKTVIPASLIVRFTGHNAPLKSDHYQIEPKDVELRIDAYKGALDNLARNALVRYVELAKKI